MARPAIYGKAMTPAERQARQREAKRAELISAVALIRTSTRGSHAHARKATSMR